LDSGIFELSIWDCDVIDFETPFIFDRRKIPDEFMGLMVR
jgi:hypothetical protein